MARTEPKEEGLKGRQQEGDGSVGFIVERAPEFWDLTKYQMA